MNKYLRLSRKPSYKELEQLGFQFVKELEWFENEVLGYLIFYFQKGYFLNKILIKNNLHLNDIKYNSIKELIELSFLKFISTHVIKFRNFLLEWTCQIKIRSIANPIILNNRIEGKILWKETFKERNYLDYPKSIKFVCNSYKNSYDSIENCILKSFLNHLKNLIEHNLKPYFSRDLKKDDWRYHAITIYNSIIKIINNFYMREVTLKRNLWKDRTSLSNTLKSCNRNNHYVLRLAAFLNNLLNLRNKELIKLFLIEQIIKPNKDKTAELYVLFTIIKVLSEIPNGNEKFYTIKQNMTGANYVYSKSFANSNVKVYYQLIPKWFQMKPKENSIYAQTLKSYGLPNSSLRPDVFIVVTKGNEKKAIIIEVKNSKNPQYLRKGLQQLCNYHGLLKKEENSIIRPFAFKKKGILVAKELPNNWERKSSERQNNQGEISILDFKQFKNLKASSLL